MVRSTQKYQCVNHYIAELHERLQKAFKEAQTQSMSEAQRQKQHYDRKGNDISLESVTSSWIKPMPTGRGER